MNNVQKLLNFLDRSEDSPDKAIALDQKKSAFSIAMVWTGIYISIAGILDGLAVINSLSLKQGIIAVFFGFVIFLFLTSLQGSVGTETGLSTYTAAQLSFGTKGNSIVSILSIIVNVGWFAINVTALTTSVMALTGWQNEIFLNCLFGLLMVVTATLGYKGIEALSMPTVFYTAGFMLFHVIRIFIIGDVNLSEIVSKAPIGNPTTIPVIVSILVGAMSAGAVNAPDIMRFSNSTKDNFKGLYLVGLPLAIILPLSAMLIGLYVGSSDFPVVMIEIGGFFGLLMVILGAWTSNDNALYSASLALHDLLNGKFKRWKIAIVTGVTATVVSSFFDLSMYMNLMLVFGSFLVPILGIMTADYFILPKIGVDHGIALKENISINNVAIVTWLIGGLYEYALDFNHIQSVIPLPSVLKNVIFCWIVYSILMKIKYNKR